MTITPEDILNIITDEANVPIEDLKLDAKLSSLGIASLDVIGISFTLEDRFDVILDPSELTEESTVGDIVMKVQALAGGSGVS